jgi:hypothetical protein
MASYWNRRLLGSQALFSKSERRVQARALLFDPLSIDQALHDGRARRELDSPYPAAAAKPLHELTFAVVWSEATPARPPDAFSFAATPTRSSALPPWGF